MGYQYGRLTGEKMLGLWWSYIGDIGEELGTSDPEDADFMVGGLLDQAWEHFEPNLRAPQRDLVDGLGDGMRAADLDYGDGPEDLTVFVHRILTLAEFVISTHLDGDQIIGLTHMLDSGYSDELLEIYGREGEAKVGEQADALATAIELLALPTAEDDGKDTLMNCSTYAAWGDRTDGGALFGTRNMDFSSDTGSYEFASVATFVPDEGIPWSSISWVGLNLGAMAAINQQGVTMGQAEAATPLERLATELGVLKASYVMQNATSLADAQIFTETAPTMGVTGVISWGDPLGGGAGAEAMAFEQNGYSIAMLRNRHDCSVETTLYRYGLTGGIEAELTNQDNPALANLEADAVEVDGEASVRYFECTDPCSSNDDLVLDPKGDPIEVQNPEDGMPIQTGYPRSCAVYRGDSAFAHGVRMHQMASHGPMDGDGTGLMIDGGAYRNRYTPQWEMTDAYEQGVAYSHDDVEFIPDNGGQQMPIGLDQVEAISRVAGMDSSNVWNVVWDATNLVIRVSFESGTGDSWVPAKDQPSYLEIDLDDLFLTD